MTSIASRRVREVPAKTDPAIPGAPRGSVKIDVIALKKALRKAVEGEVRFDPGSLALYANDSSNFRQVPIGVVIPKTLDDVVAAHRVCHQFGAPILNRGGGTSLSGETVNYAVVIDHSKYLTRIGEIDPERKLVTCQTGVINEQLNKHTGAVCNMVFGPDPSSHSRCVIGGNLGNNSCGVHSVQSQLYGPGPRTSDNTHALEIVTYDGERFWVGNDEESRLDEIIAAGGRKGEIYAALRDLRDTYADEIRARYRPVTEVPRRVSGYNLDELLPERGFNVARALVGTESTCVTVLQAVLMLTPALLQRTLVVVGYPVLADAVEHCTEIIERWRPIGLEGLDEELIHEQAEQHMHAQDLEELPKDGSKAWLLVQFGADTTEESVGTAREFAQWLVQDKGYDEDRILVMKSAQEGGQSQDIWEIREGGLGSTAFAARRGQLAGLGGLGRAAGQDRQLCHRPASADEPVRAQGCHVRALRPGLHPLPAQLRPADRRRDRQLPRVHGGGGRPGDAVRRVAVRGARRRAAAGRAAGEAVRAEPWCRRCGSSSGSGTRTGR